MAPNSFSFDHEEFKNYFLGLAIAKKLSSITSKNDNTLIKILRNSYLPYRTLTSVIYKLKKSDVEINELIDLYNELLKNESEMSFLKENLSLIILKYVSGNNLTNITLKNLALPIDSLVNSSLNNGIYFLARFIDSWKNL